MTTAVDDFGDACFAPPDDAESWPTVYHPDAQRLTKLPFSFDIDFPVEQPGLDGQEKRTAEPGDPTENPVSAENVIDFTGGTCHASVCLIAAKGGPVYGYCG